MTAQPYAELDQILGPIGEEEVPVADLIRTVHRLCCSERLYTEKHDPACNTLRLLAGDQAQLALRVSR